jgi:hypothetical protein
MRYKKEEDSPEFFSIAGNQFYFDLEELSQFIRIEKNETVDDILGEPKNEKEDMDEENPKEESVDSSIEGQIIDLTKWETIKVMIESVLSENNPIDEAMGRTKLGEQLSIPFRLSFNTLLNYKIIKEKQ